MYALNPSGANTLPTPARYSGRFLLHGEALSGPAEVGALGQVLRLGLAKLGKLANFCKFLAGSFSAVSKRIFARKYAFDSIFQALQDLHPFAPLQSQNFRKKSVWKICIFLWNFNKKIANVAKFAHFCQISKISVWESGRFWKMLQNAYLVAKIGADTAENEQHFAEILPIGRRTRRSTSSVPAATRR